MAVKVDISLDEFMSKVNKRNTDKQGNTIDPNLLRRMDHPICRKCHAAYREKYPGKPFEPVCEGIYDQIDYEEIQLEMIKQFPNEEPIPIESLTDIDIREIYDKAWWGAKHTVAKDDNGEVQPFEAREYQEEVLRCTAYSKIDRMGRGLGKAVPLNTLIPTPKGWTKLGDLQLGDTIFSASGIPTTVTFMTDVMHDHICYKVNFSDNSSVIADADHLWEVKDKSRRKERDRNDRPKKKSPYKDPLVLTTQQIKDTIYYSGSGSKPELNYSIDVCGPVQYPTQEQTITPYVLGCWLGDGSSSGGTYTCADQQLIDLISEEGWLVTKVNAVRDSYAYYISKNSKGLDSLVTELKRLKLTGNKSIPDNYLFGDVPQRLALLQGLMDTDGTITKDGYCEFSSSISKLAEQVYELVCSLGMKCVISSRIPVNSVTGFSGERNYRIQFFPALPVFRLDRKLARQRKDARPTVLRRYITSVEEVPSVPVKCIQVDDPNHLFLIGKSFIPTHNTSVGVIEELHAVCNKTNYEVLVICPADSQSEKWWNEILFQIDHSLTLKHVLLSKKQQPFRHMEFHNGSTINIFTAGSAAGRGADSLRSQSPRRIRIDEQDYLADKDWDAIGALLTRYKNSEFHGASTPTGAHGKFWEMCTQDPTFKEFYFPISVHPDWNEEMEVKCRSIAKTEERYQHEYLAEFGDSTQGVFKNFYIDLAKTKYVDPLFPNLKGYDTVRYDPTKSYFMGVDWNGEGTGTRIRVIEYDPATCKSRMAYKLNVDFEGFTVFDSIEAVVTTNRKWHCEDIYIDAGFGSAQADMIKDKGKGSKNPDDRKLQFVTVVDFGANLKFNKLKPNRDPNKRPTEEEYNRPTKPFMVEGAVMRFEQKLIEFSEDDLLLEDQLRNYRVKTYTQHGWANSYTAGKSGDHDLDAFMLALLAIEIKYGFYAQYRPERKLAMVSYASGFGVPPTTPDKSLDMVKDRAGVSSRATPANKNAARMEYLTSSTVLTTPIRSNTSNTISRTAIFVQKGTRMGNISSRKDPRGRYRN